MGVERNELRQITGSGWGVQWRRYRKWNCADQWRHFDHRWIMRAAGGNIASHNGDNVLINWMCSAVVEKHHLGLRTDSSASQLIAGSSKHRKQSLSCYWTLTTDCIRSKPLAQNRGHQNRAWLITVIIYLKESWNYNFNLSVCRKPTA